MVEIRHQLNMGEERTLGVTPVALTDSAPVRRAPATPSAKWFTHQYANAAQNGRLPAALPGTEWKERWKVPVQPGAVSVLRDAERILVQGGGWRLLDTAGRQIATGSGGRSVLALDDSARLFYLVNGTSYLEARAAAGGELSFQSPLLTNERFAWPLIWRNGKRLLLAGVEQPAPSHVPRPGTRSEVNLLEFAPKLEVDVYKQVLSLTRGEILYFDKAPMLFAAQGERFFAAAENLLVAAGSGLEVHCVMKDQFKPRWLSVDESGFLHLLVESGGETRLWVVTPEGKRVVNAAIPREHRTAVAPPVIGYDHRIYVPAQNAVLAYEPDGKTAWVNPAPGGVAGLAVTADNRLLLATGAEIVVLDAKGTRIGAIRFEGEQLTTTPVLTANGELLAGSESFVHFLAPR